MTREDAVLIFLTANKIRKETALGLPGEFVKSEVKRKERVRELDGLKKIGWFFIYWGAIAGGLTLIAALAGFAVNGFGKSLAISETAAALFLLEGLLGAVLLSVRSKAARAVIIALMVLVLFVAANAKPAGAAEAPAPCVPFGAIGVPDETRPEWKHWSTWTTHPLTDPINPSPSIGTRSFYRSDSGLTLGVYEYWGQVAFKAWACRVGPGGDTPDHMVAIPNGKGGWHIRNIQSPQWFNILSHDGTIIGRSIVLQEKPEVGAPIRVIMKPTQTRPLSINWSYPTLWGY